MAKIYLILLLITYLSFKEVSSNPVEERSFFNDILRVRHEHGRWICGGRKCPETARGCQIRSKNVNKNDRHIKTHYTCVGTVSSFPHEDTVRVGRIIDIDITVQNGRKSKFRVGAGKQNSEFGSGTVHINDLAKFDYKVKKEKQRQINLESYSIG